MSKRSSFRAWTKRDDSVLFYEAGRHPVSVVARRIRRSKSAVHQRCLALGLSWYQARYSLNEIAHQTGWDIATVKRMANIFYEVEQVGERNGTRYLLTNEQRNRLVSVLTRSHNRTWTNGEDERLLAMRAKGLTYKVIGVILKRSPAAVRTRFYQLKKCRS
jgi:hypothetical protein